MNKFITGRLAIYIYIPLTVLSFLLIEANLFLIKDHLPGFRVCAELFQKVSKNDSSSDLTQNQASISRPYVTLYMLNTLDIEANILSKQSASASLSTIPYYSNIPVWEYSSSLVLNVRPILKTRTQVLLI